jgi:hypothetical protein
MIATKPAGFDMHTQLKRLSLQTKKYPMPNPARSVMVSTDIRSRNEGDLPLDRKLPPGVFGLIQCH